ncbi:MAG: hypothetical protein ABI480_00950 [Chitinophagaceae bacterium]|jgi:hypothetical protein
MNRKYSITITAHKAAPQIADNIVRDFDCSISEPSIFLEAGTTTEKGLTFLDKKGNQLVSSIFKNQAFFKQDTEHAQSEEKAIEALIYDVLYEHYHFEKADVKVIVAQYN